MLFGIILHPPPVLAVIRVPQAFVLCMLFRSVVLMETVTAPLLIALYTLILHDNVLCHVVNTVLSLVLASKVSGHRNSSGIRARLFTPILLKLMVTG